MDKLPTSTGELTGFLHHRRITWQGTRGNRDWDARTNWDGTNPCRQRLLEARGWGTTSRFKQRFSWKKLFWKLQGPLTWRMARFQDGRICPWFITHVFFFLKKSPRFFPFQMAMKMAYYMGVGVLAGMILQGGQFNCFLCYVLLFKWYNPKIP